MRFLTAYDRFNKIRPKEDGFQYFVAVAIDIVSYTADHIEKFVPWTSPTWRHRWIFTDNGYISHILTVIFNMIFDQSWQPLRFKAYLLQTSSIRKNFNNTL